MKVLDFIFVLSQKGGPGANAIKYWTWIYKPVNISLIYKSFVATSAVIKTTLMMVFTLKYKVDKHEQTKFENTCSYNF